ncbi:MAG: MMPL family transporter, partial [Buchananella hordeovulneris]|nr:MMPL family transporter [Buchananella hordeovulneris]
MFRSVAKLCLRFPAAVAGTWVVLFVLSLLISAVGITGSSLFNLLGDGKTIDSGSRNHAGKEILEELGDDAVQITALVSKFDVTKTDPAAVQEALAEPLQQIEDMPGVLRVYTPYSSPELLGDPMALPFLAKNQEGFMALVYFDEHAPDVVRETKLDPDAVAASQERVENALRDLTTVITEFTPNPQVLVSSESIMFGEVLDQVKADLVTGELIAFPASLLVMVLIFGGFLAAGMPLLGAGASIAGAMGVLWILTHFFTIDSFVLNVVTILGLGLSIDYGMLFVSRYREELQRALPVVQAEEERANTSPTGLPLRRRGRLSARLRGGKDPLIAAAMHATLTSAGRTVFFSALTVALSIVGLAIMRPELLRSISVGAIAVILVALAASITLVPAVLVLLGRKLAGPSLVSKIPVMSRLSARLSDVSADHGFFSRLAKSVHKTPWVYLGVSLALLGAMLVPLAKGHYVFSTLELLPAHSSQRVYLDQLKENYPHFAPSDLTLIVEGDDAAAANWALDEVGALEGVKEIVPAAPAEGYSIFTIDVDGEANSPTADSVVRAIYAQEAPGEFWLVGQAATQVDFFQAMLDRLPLAIGIILAASFVLLFLMSGSLLIPIKALTINAISLLSSIGLSSWIFTNGIGESVLNYTSTGGLELMVVAVGIAFGFGLAMDYEVFLLARMKEYWDAGLSNDEAVERALQRSGRIITSAALIICIVFMGFVAGDLLLIKQVGVTLTLIVAIDATL